MSKTGPDARRYEVEVATSDGQKRANWELVTVYAPRRNWESIVRLANEKAAAKYGPEWKVRKGCTIAYDFTFEAVEAEDVVDAPD